MALRFLPHLPPRQLAAVLEDSELRAALNNALSSAYADVRGAAVAAAAAALAAPSVQRAVAAMPGAPQTMLRT